jgi:hypothetical protein
VFREYRIDGMIDVARRVMKRRKHELTTEYETMLRTVFALTRSSRAALTGIPVEIQKQKPRPKQKPIPSQHETTALAKAEAEAIRAFETEKDHRA